jgi:hypothetical protein
MPIDAVTVFYFTTMVKMKSSLSEVVTMKKEESRFSIRMNREVAKKLAYIADYYGRSLNGEIYWLAKQEIIRFEKELGEIRPEDLEEYYSGN